jgi:hypothetical protein
MGSLVLEHPRPSDHLPEVGQDPGALAAALKVRLQRDPLAIGQLTIQVF